MNDPKQKLAQQQPDLSTPWWKQGVIYQIYPRSFQDAVGDGVGDLKGITRRLDYVQSLGVSAIWISPFFLSPMKDFGYDVEDHRAIDPLFGTIQDFDLLITEAHRRGIRVLIDLVLSHTSDRHPWFIAEREAQQSELGDCYVWADPSEDGGPPNNWLSVFGGPAWTFEPRRNQYYLHNFLATQPDLNFHSEKVQQEALAIARWWLERGVDGFRPDTVNFYFHDQALRDNPRAARPDDQVVPTENPYSELDHRFDKNQPQVSGFLDKLGALLDEFPETIALGEIGAAKDKALDLMREYQSPGRLHLSYAFDLLSARFSADHFRAFIRENTIENGLVWRCLAFSNHDVRRTATRLDLDDAGAKRTASMAMALLLTLRGTPCIYQGEELGLTEADIPSSCSPIPTASDSGQSSRAAHGCRTPMPWEDSSAPRRLRSRRLKPSWLPVPLEHITASVELQQARPHAVNSSRRGHWSRCTRRPQPSTPTNWTSSMAEEMLVFVRGEAPNAALCMFNISGSPQTMVRPAEWRDANVVMHGGKISVDEGNEKGDSTRGLGRY